MDINVHEVHKAQNCLKSLNKNDEHSKLWMCIYVHP